MFYSPSYEYSVTDTSRIELSKRCDFIITRLFRRRTKQKKLNTVLLQCIGYWLLIRDGIVQCVPCYCGYFLICCASPSKL